MKLLVLDNYDSFTYNLVHILKELGYKLDVIRNDKITIEAVDEYDKILLSPGPGIPIEAGIMPDLIRRYGPTKSILGICLGHQSIGEVYGAKLENMEVVIHGFGLKSEIIDKEDYLLRNVPSSFMTGRYHSWVVEKETISDPLEITMMGEDGRVMGIKHKEYDVRGLQFHPESILTENGKQIMKNWVKGAQS